MKTLTPELNTDLQLFCPRRSCPYFQSQDNPIRKDGTYRTKHDNTPHQMFYCVKGKHRFSETGYSGLFAKHGSFKEYEQTAKMTCLGLSTEQIAYVLVKDVRTIHGWQKHIAKKINLFHTVICALLPLTILFVQMDELWSYLLKKEKRLWVFIGLAVESRFWLNFQLGSRTIHTASKLVDGIKNFLPRLTPTLPLKITTDKLAAYENAVRKIFHDIEYFYLQIVKKRWRKHLKTVEKRFVKGSPADFSGKSQNTSFIERFNLTLRQHVCYLQRKTLGYCKKKANFETVLWLNLFNYNYIQLHESLRQPLPTSSQRHFQKCWFWQTPAMAAGLTRQALYWRFLFSVPVRLNC